jgi:anthranilate synthase component 2
LVLLIDNYDSFSYNLVQLIGTFYENIKVLRNDELTPNDIRTLSPKYLVISPGPGKPSDAGICISAIKELYKEYPILGICLGHQAIYEAFGGTVTYASQLMHGKQSEVALSAECPLFKGLPTSMPVARYHSLAGSEPTLPKELEVIARTVKENEIMAVAHREYPVYGLQFHPESILTPQGSGIVKNFLELNRR